VCDLETSRMGAPYIYDISRLRVNIFYFMAQASPLPKGQHLCASFPPCFYSCCLMVINPQGYQFTSSLMPKLKNITNELLLRKQPVTWGWKYIQLPNHLIIQTTVWSHYNNSISARNADGTFTHLLILIQVNVKVIKYIDYQITNVQTAKVWHLLLVITNRWVIENST